MHLYFGWGFIIGGIFFLTTSVIGVLRFPGFYARLHAASICDTVGLPLSLIGFAFLQDDLINSIKVILLILVVIITAPVNTHMLANMAWFKQIKHYKDKDYNHEH